MVTCSEDNEQSNLVRLSEKPLQVSVSREIELVFLARVEIPHDVSLDCIETPGLHFDQPVFPLVRKHSGVVETSRDIIEGLAVFAELFVVPIHTEGSRGGRESTRDVSKKKQSTVL